jgi:alkylated DNA repair dioxygenase AlkB
MSCPAPWLPKMSALIPGLNMHLSHQPVVIIENIPGLTLTLDYITPEKELITFIDSKPWSNKLSRRTQHYGYEYNYRSTDVKKTQPLSGPILELGSKLISGNLQCIVNEYIQNQGISPHVDSFNFGPVIYSLTLGSPCNMELTKGRQKKVLLLRPRSLLKLSGEARYQWKHSIPKSATYTKGRLIVSKLPSYRRVSVTYRTVP